MKREDRSGSRMLELALWWLGQDKQARINKEEQEEGGRKRGAKDSALVRDSEKFYKQCVSTFSYHLIQLSLIERAHE